MGPDPGNPVSSTTVARNFSVHAQATGCRTTCQPLCCVGETVAEGYGSGAAVAVTHMLCDTASHACQPASRQTNGHDATVRRLERACPSRRERADASQRSLS